MKFSGRTLCPVKINLLLEVGGIRPDGYHAVQTLVAKLDFGDQLEYRTEIRSNKLVNASLAPELESHLEAMSAGEVDRFKSLLESGDNLVTKAFHSLSDEIKGFYTLQKYIPPQAGLGGGSSNAAMALLQISQHLVPEVNDWELAEKAASLGADIPHFLHKGFTMGTGKGEKVVPVSLSSSSEKFLEMLRVILVKPGFGADTKQAYKNLNRIPGKDYPMLEPSTFLGRLGRFEEKVLQIQPEKFFDGLENDFDSDLVEEVQSEGFQLFKKQIKQFVNLQECDSVSVLAGSGSTRAIIVDVEKAPEIRKKLRNEFPESHWISDIASFIL